MSVNQVSLIDVEVAASAAADPGQPLASTSSAMAIPMGIGLGDTLQNTAFSELTPLLTDPSKLNEVIKQASKDPKGYIVTVAKQVALTEAKAFLSSDLNGVMSKIPSVNEEVRIGDNAIKAFLLELAILLRHFVPTCITNIQEHTLVIAPLITIGHMATVPMAAMTIATMTCSLTGFGVIGGMASALDTVLGQDSLHASYVTFWCFCTLIVLLPLVTPIAILWLHAENILLKMGQQSDVAQLAAVSLRVLAYGMPGYCLNEVMKRYFLAQDMKAAYTSLMTTTSVLNCVLNYLLVYGPDVVRVGYKGAAMSTSISYLVAVGLALLRLLVRCGPPKKSSITDKMVAPRPTFPQAIRKLIVLGFGGIARTATAFWSHDILGFAASMLGPTTLAAQSVLQATTSSAYQICRSIADESRKRITKLLNEGHIQRARIATFAASLLAGSLMFLVYNVLWLYCAEWSHIFTEDQDVNAVVKGLLPFVSAYIVLQGTGACIDGFLRASRKPAVYSALVLSADYFGGIPVGLYLAFEEDWGLDGLWFGLSAGLLYSVLVAAVVLVRSNWNQLSAGIVALEHTLQDTVQETVHDVLEEVLHDTDHPPQNVTVNVHVRQNDD